MEKELIPKWAQINSNAITAPQLPKIQGFFPQNLN